MAGAAAGIGAAAGLTTRLTGARAGLAGFGAATTGFAIGLATAFGLAFTTFFFEAAGFRAAAFFAAALAGLRFAALFAAALAGLRFAAFFTAFFPAFLAGLDLLLVFRFAVFAISPSRCWVAIDTTR